MVLVCRFNGSGALRGFNQADCSKFLQFITGTSKVSLQSFATLEGMNGIQKFQIHREDKLTDRLSFAHIWLIYEKRNCFNTLSYFQSTRFASVRDV
ncbi:E3 ubiquitin-protein ligase HUWE1-like isoform X4 [Solenopsis invicta]|uniref:E3 ubiquitin-protein ligase HUWE1-like isoform X4 n=1 Tax=Solenopsis invicta TaxID=13686 RepID=UPI00193D261F|nr:E3 ubiquitin-protein ligase HUWE1-like isoform X4 [Solenopsis invicta]